MSFTKSTTDISVHQKLGDYPSQDDGITADELKKKFDYPAETLQEDLNKVVEELSKNTASSNIGADKIHESDASAENVQAKLEKIYKDLQNVTLGQIPDGSITEEKLNANYSSTLAKKDGELQIGLNAEKLGGFRFSDFYKIGEYTGNRSTMDTETQTIELGFKPSFLIIVSRSSSASDSNSGGDIAIIINGIGMQVSSSSSSFLVEESIEILDTGFEVKKSLLNRNSYTYTYIAVR